MKHIFTLLFILIAPVSFAQNLVPDSSFEAYTNCPNFQGQVQCPLTNVFPPTLTDWFSPLTTSTDYYNNCSINQYITTPNNAFGYLPPHTGLGYIGIVAYAEFGSNNSPQVSYREYIECQLTQPLVAGQVYYLSCYVKFFARQPLMPGGNFVALDALAANFSTTQVTNIVSPLTLPFIPMQLATPGFITDTNWVRIYGQYTATGGEEYLTIGTFNNNQTPAMVHVYPTVPNPGNDFNAYYMIDDVSLRTIPPINCDTTYLLHDTTLCTYQPSQLSPAATAATYEWSNGATTQFIEVNAAGTYWRIAANGCSVHIDTFIVSLFNNTIIHSSDSAICAATNSLNLSSSQAGAVYQWNTQATSQNISVTQPGTYYCTAIKNCLAYVDTFHVSMHATYSTNIDTAICFPASLLLPAEPNATSYLWDNGATTPAITITQPGSYSNVAIKGCDLYTVSYSVTAQPSITSISLGPDTTVCKEYSISIGKRYEGAVYLWSTGDTTYNITPTKPGMYILHVSDGCNTLTDSILVDMVSCENCLYMPTGFTPNNDGKNDAITAISNCPLSFYNIIIVNRFGEVVFHSSDILEKWNGKYKDELCDVGSYFYLMQYTTAGNGEKHMLKGDIILIR